MTGDPKTEAAAWHLRLLNASVDQATLLQFREWRARSGNDSAFRAVAREWRRAQARDRGSPGDPARRSLRSLRPPPRIAAWAVAAAIALALASFLLTPLWTRRGVLYATRTGQQSTVRLADGSTLRLDTNSRARVQLDGRLRFVRLEQGQALFDVAHDPARPFIVQADDASVTALGTLFNVRRVGASEVKVILLRGRVAVRQRTKDGTRDWVLTPGQGLSTGRARVAPVQVAAADATSWTEGRLVFHDTPIAAAVAETNRYALTPLKISADSADLSRTVDGTFVAGDTDALALALATLYDLDISRGQDGSISLRPRADGSTAPTRR